MVSGGVVNCLASTAGQMHKLGINVSGAVWVDGTSKIDVSGLGYLAGRTSGKHDSGGGEWSQRRELWRAGRQPQRQCQRGIWGLCRSERLGQWEQAQVRGMLEVVWCV